MYQTLHSIIQSIFIRSNKFKIGSIALFGVIAYSGVIANPIEQSGYELAEVNTYGSSASFATLQSNRNNTTVILYQGDLFAGCTLDYIQSNEASFNCNNEIYTLVASASTNASNNFSDSESYSGPKIIGNRIKYEYFDYPENFITDFGLTPSVKDGRIVGYQVRSIQNHEAANELNLRMNDLIVSINGVYASDPEQFSNTVESFAVASTIEMEIVRNNVELVYDTYQLDQEASDINVFATTEEVDEEFMYDTNEPEQEMPAANIVEVVEEVHEEEVVHNTYLLEQETIASCY